MINLSLHRRSRVAGLMVFLLLGTLQGTLANASNAYPGTATPPYDGEHIYPANTIEGDSIGTGGSTAEAFASKATGVVGATATADGWFSQACNAPSTPDSPPPGCADGTQELATLPAVGVILYTPLGATGPSIGAGSTSGFAYGEVVGTISNVPMGSHSASASFDSLKTDLRAFPTQSDSFGTISLAFTQADAVVEYYPCPKSCDSSFAERISVDLANGLRGSTITLRSTSFNATVSNGRVMVRAGLVSRATVRGAVSSSSAACSGRVTSVSVS